MLTRVCVALLLTVATALAASHPNVGLVSRWIEGEQAYRLCTGTVLAYNASAPLFVVTTASCALYKADASSSFNFTLDAEVPIACNGNLVANLSPSASYSLSGARSNYVATSGLGETLDFAVLQFSNNSAVPDRSTLGDLHLLSAFEYYLYFAPASAYMQGAMPVPLDFHDNETAADYSIRFEFAGYGIGVANDSCSADLGRRSNATVSRLCREQGYTVSGGGSPWNFGTAGVPLFAVDAATDASVAAMAVQFVRVEGGRPLGNATVPLVIIPEVKLRRLVPTMY